MLRLNLPQYKQIEVIAKNIPESISFSQGAVKVGGTPPEIKQYIRTLLEGDCADYYQPVGGIFPLREKIAATLNEKFHTLFDLEHVFISHGAIGGITALCLTLLGPGQEVLLPAPTYPSYHNIIKFSKASPIFVPSFVEKANGWGFDIDQIKRHTTAQTKMIILSNPSNPCGYCLTHQDLIDLKNWCESREIYLIVDEVYDHFVFEGEFVSATPLILQSDFVVRTGSFSKDFAMSGWRVGFVVASKSLIHHLTAIQDGTLCCPSVIGQYAALYALEHRYLIEKQREKVRRSRDTACQYLEPLRAEGVFSFHKPPAGIFLFLKTQTDDSLNLAKVILNEVKVALVPGRDFGPNAGPYLRLCYAREPAIIEEGMQRILNFFQNSGFQGTGS